ncbi:MAG: UDP-glucose/GDP-mannose dehydrogenase family protein, partial [Bacteroidota bacterium]
ENVSKIYGDRIHMANDQYDALIGADCLAIMTEWSVFRTPSFSVIKELLSSPAIFDGRNLYSLEIMAREGFHYESIGRDVVGQLVTTS